MNGTNVQQSPLYKKSVVFYGDSLCYARGERGESADPAVIRRSGYAGRIATRYDMELNVYAYSGWSVSDVKGGLYTRVQKNRDNLPVEEREKVDYVILEGGVNDIVNHAPLGTLSDDCATFDTATFAGALERMITLAREAYPNATIGYVIAYQMPIAEHWYNGEAIPELRDLNNVSAYVEMIRAVCERHSVSCLDLFHDTEFNETVFRVTETQRHVPSAKLQSDGLHMTSAGYDVITPYLSAWMETLPLKR